jgi:hypothetical protein
MCSGAESAIVPAKVKAVLIASTCVVEREMFVEFMEASSSSGALVGDPVK